MGMTDDEVRKFYLDKAEHFRDLSIYLLTCSILLRLKKEKIIDEEQIEEIESEPFPPTEEFVQILRDYARDLSTGEDGDPGEYVPDKMFNRMIWVIHGTCEKQLQKINIKDFPKAFSRVGSYCYWLAAACGSISTEKKLAYFDLLTKIEKIAYCLNGKAFELIGYWTAKMDYSKKNKAGAMAKKEKKKDRIKVIQNIIEKYPEYQRDRKQKIAFLAEAMSKADVTTSRSIENYLRELKVDKE